MKLPKPDFSKQGMQKFFLHHAEKLILGLAVVGTGVFFYLGYSTPSFEETTPKKLTSLADSAQQYILKDTSWETIKDYRKGDDEALQRLSDAESRSLLSSDFRDGVLNIKARSAGKRDDPELYSVANLTAMVMTAPVILQVPTNDAGLPYYEPKIRSLPIASLADQEALDDGKEEEDDGRGGLGGGSLGGPGDDDAADKKDKKKDNGSGIIHGTDLPAYVEQLMRGVRPTRAGAAAKNESVMMDMVMVTGTVDIDKQWEEFNRKLLGKRGYWPVRDRPIYQYMEIQRAEKAPDADKWTDWEDITDRIVNRQLDAFPSGMVNGAPEVIDPKFYDPVLTQPIPPITLVDYRVELAKQLSPLNISMRNLLPPPPKKREQFASTPADSGDQTSFDRFGTNDKKDDKDKKDDQTGEDRLGGDGAAKNSSSLDDPKGSDFTAYTLVSKSIKKPEAPAKLVRFFDLQVKSGVAYKYRVRCWLADPNHQPKDGLAAVKKKERKGSDLGSATGGLEGGSEGASGDAKGQEEETYVKIDVENSMLKENVRIRLQRLSNDEIPKSADKDLKLALQYARVTNPKWNGAPETNEVVVVSKKANFYAGGVQPGRQMRINDQYVPNGEPVAEIVANELSREYHAAIPGHRLVRRSDVLNFESDTNILDPVDWTKVRKARKHQFTTDAVVVDMMGGSEIREISGVASASRASMKYEIPGEVLIMDFETGTFRVQNDTADRGGFKRSLFLEDEVAEVGKKKKKKEADAGGGGFSDF